ncbi:hypothetical protein ASG38_03135 [Flavobacterium sp. Leaf359]|nr:hypothetical protein ASG38_03135 [Flavobacterium sp. Leaf359]
MLLLGCSKKKEKFSEKSISDTLFTYLTLANEDTIPYEDRLSYNKKAFAILINQENDSLNRVNLFKVANRYYNMNNFVEYWKVSKIIAERSKNENDTLNIARAYTYIGDYYACTVKKDSAFLYYTKAEKIYQKKNDKVNLGGVFISMATAQGYENDFLGSELSAIKALNVLRDTQEKSKIYEAYNILGFVSNELKDYEKSLEYHTKALTLAKENNLKNFNEVSSSLNNIGNVYQNQKKYKKAIETYEEALKDKSLIVYKPSLYGILLDNLAYSKFKLKDYSQLPGLFYKSLRIRDSLDIGIGIVNSKIHLSEYYYEKGDSIKARGFAREALEGSREIQNSRAILASLKQLGIVEPQKASIYSEEYIRINDSLQSAERKSKDKFARIEYETDEIIQQKDKLAEQNRNILFFFGLVVMIGILLFVIKNQRSKTKELMLKQAQQKANEEIYQLILDQQQKFDEGREKEKKRIAKELHDGIMNRLASIRFNLFVLENRTDPDTIRHCIGQIEQIQEVEKEVKNIAHDLSHDTFSPKKDYEELLKSLALEVANAASLKINIRFSKLIKWETTNAVVKMHIYRILQESLHNIKKHAAAKEVSVNIVQENQMLHIEIKDDGVGFDTRDHSTGLGIGNIRSRAEEMNGSSEILSSNAGTIVRIKIPL